MKRILLSSFIMSYMPIDARIMSSMETCMNMSKINPEGADVMFDLMCNQITVDKYHAHRLRVTPKLKSADGSFFKGWIGGYQGAFIELHVLIDYLANHHLDMRLSELAEIINLLHIEKQEVLAKYRLEFQPDQYYSQQFELCYKMFQLYCVQNSRECADGVYEGMKITSAGVKLIDDCFAKLHQGIVDVKNISESSTDAEKMIYLLSYFYSPILPMRERIRNFYSLAYTIELKDMV